MGICNEFTVCSASGCCVGISRGRRNGELLVSFKSGAIKVYNIHDFRLVHGWQLPSSEQLKCVAVTDPKTGLYWAIGCKEGVLQWTEEDKITYYSSHTIQSNASMLLISSGSDVPLVVYEDGSAGFVSGTTVSLIPQENGRWKLIGADLTRNGRLCVVGTNRSGVTVGIVELASNELKHPVTSTIRVKSEVVESCLCGDRLLLLCDKGHLWIVTLEPRLYSILHQHTLPPPLPDTRMLALSPDYFIVTYQHTFQLWDSQYCTSQSKLTTDVLFSSKVWCVDNCLYQWSNDKGLTGWRVEVGRAKLSSVLGKVSSLKTKCEVLPGWPSTIEDMSEWEKKKAELVLSSQQYLDALADRETTSTLESFRAVFESQPLTPNLCYANVIERLILEDRFWGRDPLLLLLKGGMVPSNIDILSEAVARDDWDIAMACLTHGPPPTEKSLVNTLHKVFSLPVEFEYGSDGSVSRKQLIYRLLSQPFNDVVMQDNLAAVPFPIIMDILSFLYQNMGVSFMFTSTAVQFPPYNLVLEWVGLILDVHFTRLAVDRPSRQLLLKLQANILSQVTCYDRLSCVSSLRDVQTTWQSNNSNRWLYKVDKVVLRI